MEERYFSDEERKEFIRHPFVVRLRVLASILWAQIKTRSSLSIFFFGLLLASLAWPLFFKFGGKDESEQDAQSAIDVIKHIQHLPATIRHSYLHSNLWQHRHFSWHFKPDWSFRVLQHSVEPKRWNDNTTLAFIEIIAHQPDIVCIQGLPVTLEKNSRDLFRTAGFAGSFQVLSQKTVGVGIFWLASKFERKDQLFFDVHNKRSLDCVDCELATLFLLIQEKGSLRTFVIASGLIKLVSSEPEGNAHWDACFEELEDKHWQASSIIFAGEFRTSCFDGDFNPFNRSILLNHTEVYMESAYSSVIGSELPCFSSKLLGQSQLNVGTPSDPQDYDLILYNPGILQPVAVLMYPDESIHLPYKTWRSSVFVDFAMQIQGENYLKIRQALQSKKRRRRNPIDDGYTAEDVLAEPPPPIGATERLRHIAKSEALVSRLSKVDALFLCFEGSFVQENTWKRLATCQEKHHLLDRIDDPSFYTSTYGSMSQLLDQLKPSRSTVQKCSSSQPLKNLDGIAEFSKHIYQMGLRIFVISDGLKEFMQPVMRSLGISMHLAFGNMLRFQQDGSYSHLHSDLEEYGSRKALIATVKERHGVRSAMIVCSDGEPAWAAEGTALGTEPDDIVVMLNSSLSSSVSVHHAASADLHVPDYRALLKAMRIRKQQPTHSEVDP